MKISTVFLILLATIFNILRAVPATPKPFLIKQSDNTTLTLYLRGDEFGHYFSTEDNVPVIQKADNSYYYAKIDNGQLVASDLLAHDPAVRANEEIGFIEGNRNLVIDKLNSDRSNSFMLKSCTRSRASVGDDQRFNHVGKKKMLIILVEFPDLEMTFSREEFDNQYNQPGYNKYNHIGSVHDYFYDQSYGMFDLEFDVVGPFMADMEMGFYGENDKDGSDKYVGELVVEAVLQADDYVDFKDYDWDGDGEVDQVFIVYAGYGEAAGAPKNTIWPHQYSLLYYMFRGVGEGPITLDDVVIDKYACSSEFSGNSGENLDGIGTFCHEFGHCLGLPDFYDTNYQARGMSFWDIMDSGTYNGPRLKGEVPTGYSAYERWKCGWLDFIDLNRPTRIEGMPSILDEPVAYRIKSEVNPNEYFFVENRQNRDWFKYVYGSTKCHGMLITHVEYDKEKWFWNTVNNTANRQGMSFIPADNQFGTSATNLEGDLFPGKFNVTVFDALSHKKMGGEWYTEKDGLRMEYDKPLKNISEADGLISFDFYNDSFKEPAPWISSIDTNTPNKMTVQCESENEVDFFEVEITEDVKFAYNNCLYDLDLDKAFTDATYRGPLSETYLRVLNLKDWYCVGGALEDEGFVLGDYNSDDLGWLMGPFFNTEDKTYTISVTYEMLEDPVIYPAMTVMLYNTEYLVIADEDVYDQKGTKIVHISTTDDGKWGIAFATYAKTLFHQIKVYDGEFSDYSLTPEGMEEDKNKQIYSEQKIVADSNECTFDGLSPSKYKLRVRSNTFDTYSDWSEYYYVTINTPNGITVTEADSDELLGIYNLQGMPVQEIKSSGVYIFKYPTRTEKRVIRM